MWTRKQPENQIYGIVLQEFFRRNYFSRYPFFRTIPVFLFKPDKLTTHYVQGKYNHYVAPVRLYLVLSFVYFLIFSSLVISQQPSAWSSSGGNISKNAQDSAEVATTSEDYQTRDNLKTTGEAFFLMGINLDELYKLSNQKDIKEDAVLDSLKIEKTFARRVFVRQALRVNRASPKDVNKAVLANLPLMMFFLLPVFAFVLKLLYIRRKKLLIEHLIFMMHFHAFYFLIFSIFAFIIYFSVSENETFFIVGFLVLLLYSYKSFRNVYQQNRFKTLLKLFLFGLIYPIILSLGLIMAAIGSLVFF